MFKAITPGFVHKIDAYLLVNYPVIWISKIHYALWHGFILWMLSAVLGLITPVNLKESSEDYVFYFLFTVAGLVFLCAWVYSYLIFNKEKKFGDKTNIEEYLNFLLTFICVAVFLMAPVPYEIAYNKRYASRVSDKEFISDINKLNETVPYMMTNLEVYVSWRDSAGQKEHYDLRRLNIHGCAYYTPYYMDDSLEFPGLHTKYQIYKAYKPLNSVPAVKQKINEYLQIAEKYDVQLTLDVDYTAKEYVEALNKPGLSPTQMSYASREYELYGLMYNIARAKFHAPFVVDDEYLIGMFYFVFTLCTFLLLYRLTYWRQFLVMIVAAIFYPIVAAILCALVPSSVYSDTSDLIFGCVIALMIFCAISIFINYGNASYFSPFLNITNQLFYISLAYLPMFVVVFLKETHLVNFYGYNMYDAGKTYRSFDTWFSLSLSAGPVLYFLCLPLLKHVFVRQLALPKKT